MNSATETIGCVKAATEILGDKWSPQLLRHFLNYETVHFCELQDSVGGINPRTLSARLVRLEEQGIIDKLKSEHSSRCEYALTSKGKALMPILKDMQTWSRRYA